MPMARPGRWALLIAALAALSACTTATPGRYGASADNVMQLKRLPAARWRMGTLVTSSEFQKRCRLAAPIQGPDGLSVPQYIERAFNDEFKMAGLYADNAAPITGTLTRLAFDTFAGIGRGRWQIDLTLRGPGGQEIRLSQVHDFDVGLDGLAACEQTARALHPAVQDLIRQAIAHPGFVNLVR